MPLTMKERFDATKAAGAKWWKKNKDDPDKVPAEINQDAVDRRY